MKNRVKILFGLVFGIIIFQLFLWFSIRIIQNDIVLLQNDINIKFVNKSNKYSDANDITYINQYSIMVKSYNDNDFKWQNTIIGAEKVSLINGAIEFYNGNLIYGFNENEWKNLKVISEKKND